MKLSATANLHRQKTLVSPFLKVFNVSSYFIASGFVSSTRVTWHDLPVGEYVRLASVLQFCGVYE